MSPDTQRRARTGADSGSKQTTGPTIRILLATLLALAVVALGGYALLLFFTTGRWLRLAQAFVPLFLGGWTLRVLTQAWRVHWREMREGRRSPDD